MARDVASLDEARAIRGVVHIEIGAKITAYLNGEVLPPHCKVVPNPDAKELTLHELDVRLRALEGK